jgi:glutaredoxin
MIPVVPYSCANPCHNKKETGSLAAPAERPTRMTQLPTTDDAVTDRVNMIMGTMLMVTGSSLAVLIFADRTGSPVDGLPAVWYSTRDFHIIICLMIFGLAAVLLKLPSSNAASASTGARPFRSIRFFTRSNCELCDRALGTLHDYASVIGEFEIIDIDASPEYHEQFSDCVPVLEIDGKVRFRGGIKPELLSRLIDATDRQRLMHTPHADISPAEGRSTADDEVDPL